MSFVDFKIARIATNLSTFRISLTRRRITPPLILFWQLQRWWRSSWSPPLTLARRAHSFATTVATQKRMSQTWNKLHDMPQQWTGRLRETAGFSKSPDAKYKHRIWLQTAHCTKGNDKWRHFSPDFDANSMTVGIRGSTFWCLSGWLRILFLYSVNDHYGSKRSWPCSQGQALH